MRIFDTKNKETIKILEDAPRIFDFLSDKSLEKYSFIKEQLNLLQIPFKENSKLVRGLDYYTHTTFEITSRSLGSQATVCGGGRYDNLISQMGGPMTSAVGFAIGFERLIILAGKELEEDRGIDIYIVNKGTKAELLAINLSRRLRNYDVSTELDVSGSSFSKQFKKANKLNAKSVVIIGDEEAINKEFTIKLFYEDLKDNKKEKMLITDENKIKNWISKNLLSNPPAIN